MGTAALLTVLLSPAVAATATFVRRRAARRPPTFAYLRRQLPALRVGVLIAAVAVVIPISLVGVDKSRSGLHGNGRISGPGYELELLPDWSDVTPQLRPGNPRLLQAFQIDYIDGQMAVLVASPPWDTASLEALRRFGGRPGGTLDGAPMVIFDPPASPARRARLMLILHGRRRYVIQLACHPRDFSECQSDTQEMLRRWHWRY